MTDLLTTEELLAELKRLGVKGKEIAVVLGIAPSAVTGLYRGTRQLKLDEARKLMQWISGENTREIPLIGMAGAGRWVEAVELTDTRLEIPKVIDAPGTFAVTVAGDSMNLVLPEGAFAIVDVKQNELFSGNIYLLKNEENEATIKVYRNDPARFEPQSTNPEHEPIILGNRNYQVIGRVTGALQKF
ncbi:hypothetical protein HHL26_06595 [Sphingobium sp. TB-6]|uniref:LexA family protein n=1 Tax=Sphingobium sp. TB-6 TaxID=2728850 RepID=UPI00146ACF80|nr:S24 family peptidase [Sphingobium sp. TB-6]NML88735.1 hypothetical protein [Sphingobium sp. TB-6]